MKLPVGIALVLLLTILYSQSFAQGKIDKSKQEIRKGGDKNNSSQPGQPSPSSKDNDDQTIGESLFEGVAKIFLYITYYSTIGKYDTEQHLHSNVTPYPYYNKRSGNYEKADTTNHTKNRFHVDAAYLFLYSNKDLTGHHIKLNIRPLKYLYVQAQYHLLAERNINNTRSNLSLFNFNLCYDRLRFEKFNLGWKAGMTYIADHVNRAGFSFGADAEAFIIKPVSIYASKQWGSIHRVAVNEFEIGAKVHIKRFNVLAGYEHLKIGSPLYDYGFLGVGLRL